MRIVYTTNKMGFTLTVRIRIRVRVKVRVTVLCVSASRFCPVVYTIRRSAVRILPVAVAGKHAERDMCVNNDGS